MHDDATWPTDARRDRLIGNWHLYQRTGGHRTSTDDLITAWYAAHRQRERPDRYLDLGCGVGSVLLMLSHKLRPRVAHGIEAQLQSVLMARRAIDELPQPESTFEIRHADFRDEGLGDGAYDLVTGSPPYFPLGTGVLPEDAQRRACRFEERGGVESYLAAAARAMTQAARCYLVFQTRFEERVIAAAASQDLWRTGQADFVMKAGDEAPFLSVFEFSRSAAGDPHRFRAAVRDDHGELSAAYRRIREELGVDDAPTTSPTHP